MMSKKLELEVRIRHHARVLTKFAILMKELLIPRPKVTFLKNKVMFSNRNGDFLMRGYSVKGQGYIGIKICRGESRKKKDVVKLKIVE